jgi:hypothetical protein
MAQFAVHLDTSYTQYIPNMVMNSPNPKPNSTHTRGAHTVLGSVILLYIHTLVQSLFSGNVYTTALYNCTLASASLGPVSSTNHRRASIYLLHCDWFF